MQPPWKAEWWSSSQVILCDTFLNIQHSQTCIQDSTSLLYYACVCPPHIGTIIHVIL